MAIWTPECQFTQNSVAEEAEATTTATKAILIERKQNKKRSDCKQYAKNLENALSNNCGHAAQQQQWSWQQQQQNMQLPQQNENSQAIVAAAAAAAVT